MAHPFTQRFGKPSPAVPSDLRFSGRSNQMAWDMNLREIGSGWFMDRFLYLFGGGLGRLHACLDAWSFLVPPGKERVVIGRNAYGTLLVLEDLEREQQVYLLDPLRVVYWTDPNLVLAMLFGRWLARAQLPHFFDDELYRLIVRGGAHLPDDVILAAKKPLALGGDMLPDNFQEEEIVSYYESTAPMYAKAFARMQEGGGKASAARTKPGTAKKKAAPKKGAAKRR